jgi:cell division GTPase FtsZ
MADLNLPDIPLEAEIPANADEVLDESQGAACYAFIGSGQGGGRLAEAFYKLGYRKTVCVNTAKQDLASLSLPEDQRLLISAGEQGAGKDMRVGEAAASAAQQQLFELIKKKFGKVDHIFICIGAGGGSGGGSSLVLVETAKKLLTYQGMDNVDQRVGVIMSLPTNGECASPNVARNAQFLANALTKYAEEKLISPLIFVDNDKIQKMYPKLTVKDFWPTVNATVAGLFHVFNLIPTKDTQYTTFDAADYGSLMRAGGCMIMGVTSVKDPGASGAISAAIKGNLEKTLLAEGFDLRTATHAAAVVLGGKSVFESVGGLMESIEGGMDTLALMTGKAMVHRGIYEDEKDRLAVYTLVGGLASPEKRIKAIGRHQANPKGDEKTESKMPLPSFGNRLYDE